MIIRILISSMLLLASASMCVAQHSDVEFTYENDVIILRDGIIGYTDGFQIFEGNFPTFGLSERFTENPGFLAEGDNMALPGDVIGLEALYSSTFESYLTYYDPDTDAMAPTAATITIEDNNGGNTSDLVISNDELSGDSPQVIQTAGSSGGVHAHIDFFLSEEAEIGAFGILFRMTTSNSMVEASQPVWLVFNYGLDSFQFEEMAIPAFVGEAFIPGDVNGDGVVDLLDVTPFVELLASGDFLPAADINGDGVVNLLDVDPMILLLSGG